MANGNTFKDLKLIFKVDDSICTSIFMYHEVVQLPILQSYSFSLDFDVTFNSIKMETVDEEMWHVGHFVVQDCNNNSYIIASAVLPSNCKDESMYTWIFNQLKELMVRNGIPFPVSIGVDRELASFKAMKKVFKDSYVFLCTKHIRDDVEKWIITACRDIHGDVAKSEAMIEGRKLVETFMETLSARTSVEQYLEAMGTFQNGLVTSGNSRHKKFQKYLRDNWLRYQDSIATCYVFSHLTYGKNTTNSAESMHSSIKRFSAFVARNIKSFLLKYIDYCTFRHTKFNTGQFNAGKKLGITKQQLCGPIFANLYGVISVICIDEMYENLLSYCKLHRSRNTGYESIQSNLRQIEINHFLKQCDCSNNGYLCPYAMSKLFTTPSSLDDISRNVTSDYCVVEIDFDNIVVKFVELASIHAKWWVIDRQPYPSVTIARKTNADRKNLTEETNKRAITQATGELFNTKRKLRPIDHALAKTLIKINEGSSNGNKKRQRRK
jgi:hypothetical protein